jgi:hypothetical protein
MSRNLPVLYSSAASREVPFGEERAPIASRRARIEAAYAAQLLGQDGRRRGLKGGQPVLEAARSAYLEAEFAGPGDRRLPAGLLRRTAV